MQIFPKEGGYVDAKWSSPKSCIGYNNTHQKRSHYTTLPLYFIMLQSDNAISMHNKYSILASWTFHNSPLSRYSACPSGGLH